MAPITVITKIKQHAGSSLRFITALHVMYSLSPVQRGWKLLPNQNSGTLHFFCMSENTS